MSPPSDILLCRYNYDPLDRLIGQSLVSLPECQRFYCKSRLATEVQGAITFSLLQGGDQLLAQRRRQDQTLDVTLLATDQQRSVLCAVHADAFPAIAYSPYGYRIAENGVTSLLGFNGERRDLLTGHYLLGNGYRAFNPVLMRFNSADSLSPFEKGGLNSYAYCLGDPINNSDPTGQFILPSRVKAMVSGWVAKAKMNLSLEVGKKISHEYLVRPSAIKNLGIATNARGARPATGPEYLWSKARRDVQKPGSSYHQYSSGVERERIVNRTEAGRWFDATPGSELDAIHAQPDHSRHAALQSVYQIHSDVNVRNHLSVAAPHVGGAFADPNPNHILARIESGLSGDIPGVMPTVMVQEIRDFSRTGLTREQLLRRFPGHFDRSRSRG